MLKILRNRRGSAEVVGFLLVLPLIIIPVFNMFYAYMETYTYNIMMQVSREALLRMEIEGGLTDESYSKILSYLEERNLDISGIHIDYTPYPVDYGEEVAFRISYDYISTRFDLVSLSRITEPRTMIYGPVKSTSKNYRR
jgi:hypothetical protein